MSITQESAAQITVSATIEKPWGHERIFASGEHGYVGKMLAIDAGEALSLQYHEHKDETIMVASGAIVIDVGPSVDALIQRTMGPGETIHIPARTLHRIAAVSASLLVEASTAAHGWQTDVIRVEDRYGRAGTSVAG
ncbi:MAG: cupin domain-containing protein [Candidatus Nanopelagicales bacterium]|nr:cupin domain-containing protein [Candidatus Nanopelagicales bacterium]